MASPPNMSPGIHGLAQAKKRTSDLALTPSGHTPKRRKPSNWSQSSAPLSAHPLRQTSFPPEPASPSAVARSPSVDAISMVSAATSAVAGPPKKKRGRKPKNAAALAAAAAESERTPSIIGDGTASTVNGKDGAGQGQAEEDDGEDDDEVNMAVVDTVRTQEQKQEELRLRAMLVEAFDDDQYSRYEVWRASKLSDAVVKRVVNTAVSQSVPPTVTLAVKSVAKLFAGNIVEMARQVQAEWIAAGEEQADVQAPLPPTDPNNPDESAPVQDLRAPLRPDHLREAWRRYRAMGEGAGVGSHALWHMQQGSGVSRFATRTGKRLFR